MFSQLASSVSFFFGNNIFCGLCGGGKYIARGHYRKEIKISEGPTLNISVGDQNDKSIL
jgi:hypothetical protein